MSKLIPSNSGPYDKAAIERNHAVIMSLIPKGYVTFAPNQSQGPFDRQGNWRPNYDVLVSKIIGDTQNRLHWDPFKKMSDAIRHPTFSRKIKRFRTFFQALLDLTFSGAEPKYRAHEFETYWWYAALDDGETLFSGGNKRPDDDVIVGAIPITAAQEGLNQITSISQAIRGIRQPNWESWNPVGVLGAFGYNVAQGGVPTSKRHHRLEIVACCELEKFGVDHVAWWGKPRTRKRVRCIMNVIETFTKLASSRRSQSMGEAIKKWNEDLEWMRLTWKVPA
jgi:hypothetical protein